MQLMLYSIVTDDQTQLTRVVRRIGNEPPGLDEQQLMKDLAQFVGRYSTQELTGFQTAAALQDFVRIVREHKILLPADVATLVKVLVTLEGTSKLLTPDFSLMQVMRPFLRRMMLRRLSPHRQLRLLSRFFLQAERLAESMPHRMETILDQIQSGRFDVHLDHRRLGPSVNRLVMGMVTSALFLGSALLLSYKVPPLLFPQTPWWGIHQLSMMGVMGTLVSLMLGARLIWAIRKSGNLDRNDA
jgi:ubiquinone biosynthesis protein